MRGGGTSMYCPTCGTVCQCRVVSLSRLKQPKARRYHYAEQMDVQFFRRARQCSESGHLFLTAELAEKLVDELVDLRDKLARLQRARVERLLTEVTWLNANADVPKELAVELVRASAWWPEHPSGQSVRARRHANRVGWSDHHGWCIWFGDNCFLVSKAVQRCRAAIHEAFAEACKGRLVSMDELKATMARHVSGAVATRDNYEYRGYYPVTNGEMRFGNAAIDVNDVVSYLLSQAYVEKVLI